MVAAAIVGGAAITAGVGAMASSSAANTQADAANNAAGLQWQQYQQNRTDLAPYRDLGQSAINPLKAAMGYSGNWAADPNNILQQKFSFTPGDLTKYPGYQFAFQQGMQGVNASAAAKGLGVSGADVRGAADYATGLASQTYGQAYDQALNTFNTNYSSAANNVNRLYQLMSTGQNSAAQTANLGAQTASNAGQLMTSGAAAQAAGTVGAANALTGAVGGGLNYYGQYNLANSINNASGGGNAYQNMLTSTGWN